MLKGMAVIAVLMMTGAARGQAIPDSGIRFKGTCSGTWAIADHSPIPDAHPIKCDSLIVMQVQGHAVVAISNGDPNAPVLEFTGNLFNVVSGISQAFDPYMGAVTSAFTIAGVAWGDGKWQGVKAPPQMINDSAGRGCYFHFSQGQDWNQLTEVECELILGVSMSSSDWHRATVTFKAAREFTVDGQKVSVEFGTHGANSFRTEFAQTTINGTCGMGIYQTTDGALRHAEPGSAIERLFQTVCYKSK